MRDAMANTYQPAGVPSAMHRKLRAIRFRNTLFVLLRAFAISASVLIAAMVIAMILDWGFVLFSTGTRVLLTSLCIGLAFTALLATAVPALGKVLRETQPAMDADRVVPELEERWTTVTGFAASKHKPTSPAAKAMLQQVTSEAIALAVLVQPQRVVRPQVLRPSAYMLCGTALLLAAFLAVDWPQTRLLLVRFWAPTANITATQLESASGNVTIPRHEPLELVIRQIGVQRTTGQLTIEYPSGTRDAFALDAAADQPERFVHSIRADESFRYRFQAGDARTPWHDVTVIDYPTLSEFQMQIVSPKYVDRPPYERQSIPSRVRAIEGSRLTLRMKPAAPLKQLTLTVMVGSDEQPQEHQLVLEPDADGWYHFENQLFEDLSFTPALLSPNGLTNELERTCQIELIHDSMPVARIISPTEEMAVAADDVIDVQFEAHDDFGIKTAELVVYDETHEGEEPRVVAVQEIPLEELQGKRHLMMNVPLDLKSLALREGAQISYAVRVTDNRMVQRDAASPDDASDAVEKVVNQSDTNSSEPALTNTPDKSDEAEMGDGNDSEQSLAGAPPDSAGDTESEASSQRPPSDDVLADGNDDTSAAAIATADEDKPAPSNLDDRLAASIFGEAADSPPDLDASTASPAGASTHQADEESAPPAEDEANERVVDSEEEPASAFPTDSDDANETKLASNQPADKQNPADDDRDQSNAPPLVQRQANEQNGTSGDGAVEPSPDPPPEITMNPQRGESGQNAETARRRLKIAERLTSVASASVTETEKTQIRDRVVAIDQMLAGVQSGLKRAVERAIPDADRGARFGLLDEQLGEVQQYIADLRAETKEKQFAFVGLQMVEIDRTHIAPARNQTFLAIRDPNGQAGNAGEPLRHIVRARELLAALLKRYDRVARDRELAEELDENIKIYEVYVERMQQLMRERRQTSNPLQRKMGIIDVDQDYLDRFAEVLTLRREMMREFGRMLADDPRLLSRYLDLSRRRRGSFRDQLSELAARQDEVTYELNGWMAANDAQRDDVWMIVQEMRSHLATELAREVAEFVERIEKQLPLVLDPEQSTASAIIAQARDLASVSRAIAFEAERVFGEGRDSQQPGELTKGAAALVDQLAELDARLDRLSFENDDSDEITGYVTARLLESRTVADRAEAWQQIAGFLQEDAYHGLAAVDQRRLEIETELLRVAMLEIETELNGEFQLQAETDVPAEIVDIIHQLHGTMEQLTLQQAAATFLLSRGRLEPAAEQQAQVSDSFQRAEELFDQMRRAVIDALDEYDPEDPNIADLEDPTLDEFLARLEREPNIESQLGIPNRPRNLRVIADSLLWQQEGGGGLGESSEAARSRAEEAMKMQRIAQRKPQDDEDKMDQQNTPTEEEREQLARAKEMEDAIVKALVDLEEQAEDPALTSQQRRELDEQMQNMRQMLEHLGSPSADAEQWQTIAESDQAKAILRALAAGETLPDEQWNTLLSQLSEGLWQGRGRTPPEEYRQAIEQYQDQLRNLMSENVIE